MTSSVASGAEPAAAPNDSLPAILARRASLRPDESCFHTVKFVNREPIAQPYSNGELFSLVERAAASLSEQGVEAGQRLILSLSNAADFLSFMLGAQCLGAIAVPAPSASELPRSVYARRLAAIARDAEPVVAVVDDEAARDTIEHECPAVAQVPDETGAPGG